MVVGFTAIYDAISAALEYSAKALLFKAESTKLRFLVYSVYRHFQ
jgi:hypothetical protein